MSEKRLIKLSEILTWFFVVFMFILELLIISGVVGTLPVHASESSYSQKYTLTWTHTVSTWQYPETRLCVYSSDAPFVIVRQESNVEGVYVYYVKAFIQNSKYPNGILVNLNDSLISEKFDWDVFYTKDNVTTEFHNQTSQLWSSHTTRKDVYSDGNISESTVEADFPIFDTNDHALAYCQTGSIEGLLNGDSVFPSDESYTYTGFTMNGKTASWTGTTQRSNLLDQDVEEYTTFTYGFASSEDQTVSSFIEYDGEYATADKKLKLPWDEMEANKKDGEFIRQVNIVPSYRVPGAFYHGMGAKVYFHKDGSVDKVVMDTKKTDLNTGNMVYDSSIGYLQNVIYTEEKTHDGTGRKATFKWSTQKTLPDDAQVEIVAQNFYIQWFNKKTQENFIYKEYGEDCIYSVGSYSFNANTPVWTWLKEKDIDPFSIKTQSYGTTEYYLRIVTYDDSDLKYHYGGWVRVDIKEKTATRVPSTDVETGDFDDVDGLWKQDTTADDSYHYSTDDEGKITGNIDVNSWEDLNMNSFTWLYRNMQSMVSSLGEFPSMISAVFGFLPVQFVTALGVLLVAIVLLRFLGR